jgi:hypothetical protein
MFHLRKGKKVRTKVMVKEKVGKYRKKMIKNSQKVLSYRKNRKKTLLKSSKK